MGSKLANCLIPEQVERFLSGRCNPKERQSIRDHLNSCESCKQRVKEAQKGQVHRSQSEKEVTQETGKNTSPEKNVNEFKIRNNQPMPDISQSPPGQGASASSFETLLLDQIEGYKILEEFPRGGQGIVYKAIHLATKTKVALKILQPARWTSPKARRYFEREVELIATLDHPNIVKIRDSGISKGQYFFAMEYIRGEALDRYVDSRSLPFRECILLFKKICTAINYAHQKGIIHRDLKTSNILVDERGEPHILDFGLAKAAGGLSIDSEESGIPTITGQLLGSYVAMSPEQAAGRPDLIDMRTDVYSLGALLYRILLRQYPYDLTGSTYEILDNIQKAEPARPRQIRKSFNLEMEAILLKALAKDRTLRYQSVAQFQDDVERWLDNQPISVRSINSWYLFRKLISRHRYAASILGLVFSIILGFSIFSIQIFYLWRNEKSKNYELYRQLEIEQAQNMVNAYQETFFLFLREWCENREKGAVMLAGGCGIDTREAKAVQFLLDTNPITEKEIKGFRDSLGESDPHFAEFVLAEYYLQNQNLEAAVKSYRRCQDLCNQFKEDGRLQRMAGARLVSLNAVSHSQKIVQENSKTEKP